MNKWLVALTLMVTTQFAMAGLPPDQLVKKTSEDVLAIVKTDKDIQSGNMSKIYALAEEKVLPNTDMETVCRLVLGKNWNIANPDQKAAFLKEFKTLLMRTYATALSKYKNQPIDYKAFRMQPDDKLVSVKTVVTPDGGQPIGIDYTLQKNADNWKLIDIVVENVSLVTNYRSQFAQEVRQNGLDVLIKKLVDKNNAATK